MAVRRTHLQHYNALIEKFNRYEIGKEKAIEEIRKQLQSDAVEMVSGATPQGEARVKWLARLGHPYGRGNTAAESTPTSRPRGPGKYKRGPKKGKSKGRAPYLPIGTISGNLKQSAFARKDRQGGRNLITYGYGKRAGGALFAVLPAGTKKMHGRGVWAPGQRGELNKRSNAYRKAYRDQFIRDVRKP